MALADFTDHKLLLRADRAHDFVGLFDIMDEVVPGFDRDLIYRDFMQDVFERAGITTSLVSRRTSSAQPTIQSSGPTVFTSVTNTTLTVSWTVGTGNGNNRILLLL